MTKALKFMPPLMRLIGFGSLGFCMTQLSPWLGASVVAVMFIFASNDVSEIVAESDGPR